MADLSGTGTLSSPKLANRKLRTVYFSVAVNSGDTYTAPFATITAAWFVPTTQTGVGVDWSGKVITISLAAAKTGRLHIEGY